MPEQETRSEPAASRPNSEALPFSELPKRERRKRAAMTAFTIFHLLAVLVGGAVKEFKDHFVYLFGAYEEGFRMTNSWGMFGKPPTATHIVIEGETAERKWVVLSTTRAQDRTFFERIRDVRMRKLQGKLAEKADRNRLGQPMLAHFCALGEERNLKLQSVRVVHQQHQELGDDGKETKAASSSVVLRRSCVGPKERVISELPRFVPAGRTDL